MGGAVVASEAQTEVLRDKNLTYLKDNLPGLYRTVVDWPSLSSELQICDGKVENLLVNGTPLYGRNFTDYCRAQMDDFWDNMERIKFSSMKNCNPSNISRGMVVNIHQYFFKDEEEMPSDVVPVVDSGFCFVFGLGLGGFLRELIEKKIARNLVIIEPLTELFVQSLSVVDWEEVYQKAEENGIAIHFFLGKTPRELAHDVEGFVRRTGNTFIEGSSFLIHYPSWELQEAYRILREQLKTYYITSGFFEDELVMMRNGFLNASFTDFRIIRRKPYMLQEYPVFIVASGPSLEFDLENIRKIRDQIILVSSGTTLHLLMKKGLRPDFHTELENGEVIYDFLKKTDEKYSLKGVSLLASLTVDPRIPDLFDDVYYYARGSVSSTTVFMKGVGSLTEVAPMSANSAITCMATLGFRNFYLAGVDCGRYVGAHHHADGSVYDGLDIDEQIDKNYNVVPKVPGNFGGEVETTIFLDMSRKLISALIKRLNLNVYNCSHGARIELTKPLASGSIKLNSKPGKQEHIKQLLRDQCKLYKNGEFVDHAKLERNVANVDLLKERMADFLKDQKDNFQSFYDFDRDFHDFWNSNWEDFGDLFIIMGGSYASMIRMGVFMGNRLKSEEHRKKFFCVFADCFLEQCNWMVEVLRDFYSKMVAGERNIDIPPDFEIKEHDKDDASIQL
ncbi:MAG: motility associated factor glycosyltransferase family protein [Methylocystaceae bacterium]|nr:motility associated factor glycosyltransferase family protein [Methylocystaceae bacterium]